MDDGSLPEVGSLADLAELVGDRTDVYVRWSRGPDADDHRRSRDSLTGVQLPGLSANALAVEPWWGGRSRTVWMARRLYDYLHLANDRPRRRAWVLEGRECGRGPDNEPLVDEVTAVAVLSDEVAEEARRVIEELADDGGSLER
jgi:hypothetical protein